MASVAQRIQSVDASTFKKENNAPDKAPLRFPAYQPTWNPETKYPPYEEFEFSDPGLKADPKLANLFPNGLPSTEEELRSTASKLVVKFGYSAIDLTPKFGSEIRGIQLSQLSTEAKNDLAKYVAERGVVIFRDQDFRELPIPQALEWAKQFGRQHVHPTSGSPAGHDEVHLVFREEGNDAFGEYFKNHISSVAWHSDVTYEQQPPGTTVLGILERPPNGGDTLFADTHEIYNRLSPEFKKRLHGLRAVHSAYEQAENSRSRGGVVRREPVRNVHPVVRTHPVTNKKALFVNHQFTRNIVGYKQEESDNLLNFLYDVISKAQDTHLRARWEDGTVVVWDNRRTVHSALLDWDDGKRRHAFRYTPQAEKPFETPYQE